MSHSSSVSPDGDDAAADRFVKPKARKPTLSVVSISARPDSLKAKTGGPGGDNNLMLEVCKIEDHDKMRPHKIDYNNLKRSI